MKNITFSGVFNTEGVATIISGHTASSGRGQQGPVQQCVGRCQMGAGVLQQRWPGKQNRDAEAEVKDCCQGHRHHPSLTGSISKSAAQYLQARLAASLETENPMSLAPRRAAGRQGDVQARAAPGFRTRDPGRSSCAEDTNSNDTAASAHP